MANWAHKLDIKDEYNEAKAGTLTPYAMAQRIATKIKEMSIGGLHITRIAEKFQGLPENATFDDTDDAMEMLYNWGDGWHVGNTKTCWIATF